MVNSRYNLSDEGFDRLTKKLAEIAQEGIDDTVEGLQSGTITTNFVKTMTKVNGMEDVIERNEQLSKTYQGLISLYGFDTMYDMYLYARSCDILPEELLKSSSNNALVLPIQKTVIRNGKPLEVTVYEVIRKAAAPKKKAEPKKEEEIVIRHAREFKGSLTGDGEAKDPSKVAKVKAAAQKLTGGNKPFSDKSHHYLSLRENSRTVAVIGYSTQGEHMTMDFYRTNGQTNGVAARGFAELVRLAIQKEKGVKVEDHPGARAVYTQFGLKQEGDHWVADHKELKQSLGEGMDSE